MLDHSQPAIVLLYALPLMLLCYRHIWRRRVRETQDAEILQEAIQAGLTEPVSLHPEVRADKCVGAGCCVKACPEGALGFIDGKAQLVNPSICIGHGACQAACPTGAIDLVFGTERRGVDIPLVKPNFETNVAGIFIAGELGGMGLIRKASEQGVQSMEAIAERSQRMAQTGKASADLDVVIVGAGPAGLAAGLAATHKGLSYRMIEQEPSLGGAIFHYPRNKIAMTAPVNLPIVGKMHMTEVSKEALLAFWFKVVKQARLSIDFGHRMLQVDRQTDGSFVVQTSQGNLHAKSVLLAIGRRGTPRQLGVAGEEQSKVVYRLVDPEQYRGQRVLVVGGGDSAVEAACSLAELPQTTVHLSYRGEAFNRVKTKNRERLNRLTESGRLTVWLQSNVQVIQKTAVLVEQLGTVHDIPNDAVVLCTGGVLPIPLLQEMGIQFETKRGTA